MIRTALRRTTRLKPSGRLRPRRKTRKGRIPMYVLDALWSRRIHERDKVCRFVGGLLFNLDAPPTGAFVCVGKLEAAHMFSKKAYPHLRWDLDNGNLLCTKHHFYAHQNPLHASRFYKHLWGEAHLDSLWIRAQAAGKVDRAAVKAHLQGLVKHLEGRSA